MTRRRVAVALLLPPHVSAQVQALRLAVGDPRWSALPPHLTLVPPVNLASGPLSELRRVLRSVATASTPFDLALGPAGTFAPATPTLHLTVSGRTDELHELRDALRVAPIDRPDSWPFVPHVTLRESMDPEALDGALATLSSPLGPWIADRLHLLEQFRDEGRPYWRPVVEEPFGGPVVVGRGGVELVLRTVELLEPEVAALLREVGEAHGGPDLGSGSGGDLGSGSGGDLAEVSTPPHTLVVVAELPGRPGEPVAAVAGRALPGAAVVHSMHVAQGHQGFGVGRQVAAQWCVDAARRGASVAVAPAALGAGALESWGFTRVGDTLLRRLGARPAE